MITNLFSVFDPTTAIFSINWFLCFSILVFTSISVWKHLPSYRKIFLTIINKIKIEIKLNLGKYEKDSKPILITLFITIILINFLALYPHVFSLTSQVSLTLPLSLLAWTSVVTFGWIKNTNHILSHLLPKNTPSALMISMVIIELVRNITRPLILFIRLSANLRAGHLLMNLLGGFVLSINTTILLPLITAPLLLAILESAVACIQAYVFVTLITLYITETK